MTTRLLKNGYMPDAKAQAKGTARVASAAAEASADEAALGADSQEGPTWQG